MEWALSYFTWQRRSRVILEVPSAPTANATPSVIGRVIRLDGAQWDGQGKQIPKEASQALPAQAPRQVSVRSPL
jgi:hypothetical protein